MSDAGSDGTGRARRTWAAFGHVLGRLGWAVMFLSFAFLACAGFVVAYQHLAGPYCDGHRMGPADTCSVVAAPTSRSSNTIEQLNPAGTAPAVLTVPANWHAKQENIRRGVYTPAGMRDFHRSSGYFMLGGATLLALIPGSFVYRIVRARRSAATTAPTEPDRDADVA